MNNKKQSNKMNDFLEKIELVLKWTTMTAKAVVFALVIMMIVLLVVVPAYY